MRKLMPLCLLVVLIARVAYAQSDCGNGLPCGSIPWPQPNPPQLQSPTPMPTIGVTLNPPTQTPGGPTATPAPTNAGFEIDTSGISDQFATLQALAEATDPVVMVSGTPLAPTDQYDTLTDNSATFFSYVRAVNEIDLGGLNPIIGFVTVSFLTVLGVKIITLLLPVLATLFGFARKVVGIVLDFLPF